MHKPKKTNFLQDSLGCLEKEIGKDMKKQGHKDIKNYGGCTFVMGSDVWGCQFKLLSQLESWRGQSTSSYQVATSAALAKYHLCFLQ